MHSWSIYNLESYQFSSDKKKMTTEQENKQKRSKCPERAYCLSQRDWSIRVCCSLRSRFGILGFTCASKNLFLPAFCDNLFNIPYSISASSKVKLSLNGNFPYHLLIIAEKYLLIKHIVINTWNL